MPPRWRVNRFLDNHHMNVVRLSALRTGRIYLPAQISRQSAHEGVKKYVGHKHRPPLPPKEIFLVLISFRDQTKPHGHSAAGKIMSMKNLFDTIGNRTCNLSACSALRQSTAPPAACPTYSVVQFSFCNRARALICVLKKQHFALKYILNTSTY